MRQELLVLVDAARITLALSFFPCSWNAFAELKFTESPGNGEDVFTA
jgi:hypothetical protein